MSRTATDFGGHLIANSKVPVFPWVTDIPGYRSWVQFIQCNNRLDVVSGAYLCFPVLMFPESMFPGTYVPQYLCSPVPMFPGFCTLIVVISIHRLEILPTPWYNSRLWLCLGFRFMVLVRVRVRVRLVLQTVFRFWLGCGLGLSLYG